MHRLLRRQLRKHLGVEDKVPVELEAFMAAVDAAYADSDSDRAILERSLELSSKELSDAQIEATEARHRLTDAIESTSEGFAFYDAEDRLVLCNSQYRRLLYPGEQVDLEPGISFEEVLRRATERGFIEHGSVGIEDYIRARIERHRNPGEPFLQQRADGRWLQISERRTQGGGTVAVYSDLTELKRREEEVATARDEAMQATQAKSQFLANMSHELRTPLNAIIGITEMLQEDAEDLGYEDFIEPLERISKAGKHLLYLINEILDLSKIEAGKVELHLEDFDVETLVQEVVTTAQPLAEKNGNRLKVQCDGKPGRMHADLTRVRQVVFNLLSNACKFTNDGEVTVLIARERHDGSDWLKLSVEDTGIGMSPDQVAKLFQEFRQADASTTKKYGGTGLGLAISQRLCTLMGGDIKVESKLGEGTTFTARLPADVGEKAAEPRAKAAVVKQMPGEKAASPVRAGKRTKIVLVVDDDPTVHELMRRFLAKEGFDVVTASDGEEGLKLARELKPALITLDVIMPGLDGWSVLSELQSDPELSAIPVVMLTILDEQNKGYALGAADYMTKPIDRGYLRTILRKYRSDDGARQVLVVDDDGATREMLRRMLVNEGWQVIDAENGRDALDRLTKIWPDLILLDLMMPEMDGFEFLAALREKESLNHIPVVVVTAADLSEEDHRRLCGGVQHVLQKAGYACDDLLTEIRDVVVECVGKDASHG